MLKLTLSRCGGFAAAALVLCACATSNPATQKMAAGATDKAVLLMRVDPGFLPYEVQLSTFDESKGALLGGSFGGLTTFHASPRDPYVAETVSPGTYVFQMFRQQELWNACFQSSSVSFEVRAGEVLYLGEFDPREEFQAIQRQAIAENKMAASRNSPVFFFDNIPAPPISFPADKEGARIAVQAFVDGHMPDVKAQVRLAELHPTKFGNGVSLFGQPVCGGYFKKPPK